ncbi:MAG: hypothetical protein KY455_10780 [Euryarchaeota archaeon]|nr:hypothetical protein [Euryarchaeota archaeon]
MRDVLSEHCAPLLDALMAAQEDRSGIVEDQAASDAKVCLRERYGLELPAVVAFEDEIFSIEWRQGHVGPY